MLGKIFKHEFKSEVNTLGPACGIVMIVTLLEIILYAIISQIPKDIKAFGALTMLSGFSTFLMVFSVILLISVAPIISAVLFYRSVASNEGYLTHTLPISKTSMVVGKNLSAFVVNMIVIVIGIICLVISGLVAHKDLVSNVLRYMKTTLISIAQSDELTPVYVISIILFILSLFVQIYNRLSVYYACVSIGQINNNHKILMAIITYIAYTTIMQILSSIFSIIISIYIPSLQKHAESIDYMIGNNPEGFALGTSLFILILNILFSVLFNFISIKILDKKLNLE